MMHRATIIPTEAQTLFENGLEMTFPPESSVYVSYPILSPEQMQYLSPSLRLA